MTTVIKRSRGGFQPLTSSQRKHSAPHHAYTLLAQSASDTALLNAQQGHAQCVGLSTGQIRHPYEAKIMRRLLPWLLLALARTARSAPSTIPRDDLLARAAAIDAFFQNATAPSTCLLYTSPSPRD